MGAGDIIGGILRDVDNLKSGVHDIGDTMSYILSSSGVLTIVELEVEVEERDYNVTNLVLILGHPTRGILGTNKLGTDATAFDAWTTVETLADDQILTNAGRNHVRDALASDAVNGITHVAFGSDDTAYNVEQETLGIEEERTIATNVKS